MTSSGLGCRTIVCALSHASPALPQPGNTEPFLAPSLLKRSASPGDPSAFKTPFQEVVGRGNRFFHFLFAADLVSLATLLKCAEASCQSDVEHTSLLILFPFHPTSALPEVPGRESPRWHDLRLLCGAVAGLKEGV